MLPEAGEKNVNHCKEKCENVLATGEIEKVSQWKCPSWGWLLYAVTFVMLPTVSCVVPAQAWVRALAHLGPIMANNVFVCDSCSERLTGSKCRSFIACLF